LLKNVFNSKKGSIEGFKYSQAMLNKGGIWGVEELYYFIKKPKNYIKGTNMGFAGIKKDSHLKHLIAYIKSNSNK